MVRNTVLFTEHQHLIKDPDHQKDPIKLQHNINKYEQIQREQTLSFIKLWKVALWLSVPTAVLAILLLTASYIAALIQSFNLESIPCPF